MKERVTAAAGLEMLRQTGVEASVVDHSTVLMRTAGGDSPRPAHVRVLQNPPTPSVIQRDLDATEMCILYVVPRATKALRAAAIEGRVIVASMKGREVLFRGLVHREAGVDSNDTNPQVSFQVKTPRRPPYGRYALIRSLLRTPEPRTQKQLAAETGITQAAVSNNLKLLGDRVTRTDAGWHTDAPEALFADFMTGYPGPGGIESYWFSLKAVKEVASTLGILSAPEEDLLISGDVGADYVAPWRRPTVAVFYAKGSPSGDSSLAGLGLGEASEDDSNLEFVVPADLTIWSTARAWLTREAVTPAREGPTLATDPLIIAWDVARLGGPDAGEAVDAIRARVLKRWGAR